mmetsp:Transcript_50992/g.127981  ORF Transcript_50992/g.127981 Transcript_50992/m.127981 type:complete len:341 (+) Transcript_50992:1440-2462(+)
MAFSKVKSEMVGSFAGPRWSTGKVDRLFSFSIDPSSFTSACFFATAIALSSVHSCCCAFTLTERSWVGSICSASNPAGSFCRAAFTRSRRMPCCWSACTIWLMRRPRCTLSLERARIWGHSSIFACSASMNPTVRLCCRWLARANDSSEVACWISLPPLRLAELVEWVGMEDELTLTVGSGMSVDESARFLPPTPKRRFKGPRRDSPSSPFSFCEVSRDRRFSSSCLRSSGCDSLRGVRLPSSSSAGEAGSSSSSIRLLRILRMRKLLMSLALSACVRLRGSSVFRICSCGLKGLRDTDASSPTRSSALGTSDEESSSLRLLFRSLNHPPPDCHDMRCQK